MLKYMRHVQPVNSATAAVGASAGAKLRRGSTSGNNNSSNSSEGRECSSAVDVAAAGRFGAVSWVLGSRRSVSSCWLSRSCARTEKSGTPALH